MKIVALAALCGAALLVLTACGQNYSGRGNAFFIEATVDHAGKNSVTIRDVNVIEAYGKARKWFHGKHQVHDNYNTCEWHGRHRVGYVYDARQNEISIRNISRGARVEIRGSIRENASSCGKQVDYSWRPVFDSLREK